MNPRCAFALLCALLAFGAVACDDNSLSGSLTDYYDSSFDNVRARLYDTELTIEYVRDNGEVPVRISLKTLGEELSAKSYSLTDRGTVTGRTGDSDIPAFLSGTLELSEFSAKDGGAVVGSFSARFRSGKDTLSLTGEFDTSLELATVLGYEIDGYPPPEEVSDLEDEDLVP